MIYRASIAAAFIACTLFAGSTAHALSCQGRLIDAGAPPARVRALCGTPTSVTQSVVQASQSMGAGPYWLHRRSSVSQSFLVERWLYDFGPNRFMQELTFVDGRLRGIVELGYGTPQGHAELDPPSASPRRAGLETPALAVDRRRLPC